MTLTGDQKQIIFQITLAVMVVVISFEISTLTAIEEGSSRGFKQASDEGST